jgi:hypothetical protein
MLSAECDSEHVFTVEIMDKLLRNKKQAQNLLQIRILLWILKDKDSLLQTRTPNDTAGIKITSVGM